jgi:hypothetical protein
LGHDVEILSDILYWLFLWFLVSIPVALVLAQLLKAASVQLQLEEAERRLELRGSDGHPFDLEVVRGAPTQTVDPATRGYRWGTSAPQAESWVGAGALAERGAALRR